MTIYKTKTHLPIDSLVSTPLKHGISLDTQKVLKIEGFAGKECIQFI